MGVLDQIRAHHVDMSQRIRFVGSRGEALADSDESSDDIENAASGRAALGPSPLQAPTVTWSPQPPKRRLTRPTGTAVRYVRDGVGTA